jgi:hypothetical protein
MAMSKVMRQMPAPAGRAGLAHGEAGRDPASDETLSMKFPKSNTYKKSRITHTQLE